MIVKFAAMFFLLGVCCAFPLEEPKPVEVAPSYGLVPLPTPTKGEAIPNPPKPDNSDLKADASTWWHSWYKHEYPVYYYYDVHKVPHYTYHYSTHW